MATKKQNNKQLNIKNNLHIIHPTSFFWANGPHTLNQPFVLSFTPYGTSEESCNKHCNKPSWRSEDTWWVWVWQDGAVQSATSRQIGWEGPNAKRLGILKTWSSTGCCCFADPFLLEQFAIMSNIVLNIQFDFPVWFYLQVKKNFGTKQMFHQRISATFNRHYLHVCSIFWAQNSDTDNCGILFPGRNPSPLVVDWWAQVGGWRMNLAEPHGLICNIERHEDLLGYVELNIFSPLTQQSHPWQGLWDQCLQTRTWFVGKTLTKIPHCLETQKHLYMFWYLKFN